MRLEEYSHSYYYYLCTDVDEMDIPYFMDVASQFKNGVPLRIRIATFDEAICDPRETSMTEMFIKQKEGVEEISATQKIVLKRKMKKKAAIQLKEKKKCHRKH